MRPTALIRKMLQLEGLEKQTAQQLQKVKKQLRENGISIQERDERALDIRIQYRWKNRIHEAIYMRAMLDAELKSITRRLGEEEK